MIPWSMDFSDVTELAQRDIGGDNSVPTDAEICKQKNFLSTE
jgi:hypothetical protein